MADNRRALLIASFLTLIAAGVGFAIRGAILNEWGAAFGFTKGELGSITGGGLIGFGVTILIFSLFVDKVGYKPLLVGAFLLHVLSAVVTLAASWVFEAYGKDATYWCLFIGMFMFALGNGVCEAAINPLIATLYAKEKTHYLNILHAGWPGGLILGGVFAYFFCGADAKIMSLQWEIPMAMFLVPTLLYGVMVLKEQFPISEATAAGVKFGEMFSVFASPILLLLLLLHAAIGYVELGTDSWIINITNNAVGSYATLLFVYTSALMFVLRFFAGPIVERINPLGLLCLSSILGCVGLYWLGSTGGIAVIAAATVYGLGKTFLWPTILGVVGERFPKGGALVMGAMGGVGALSAGVLGTPGIGYKQDYFASQELKQSSAPTYERYVSNDKRKFLVFPPIAGLDGQKVATLDDHGADLAKRLEVAEGKKLKPEDQKNLDGLVAWWDEAKSQSEVDAPKVKEANLFGGQMALKWTAVVPLGMAVGFLLLVIYFRMQGGYKQEHLHDLEDRAPMEA